MSIVPGFSAKDVYELIKKGHTIEAQQQIVDLQASGLELQRENLRLRYENQSLKRQLDLREKVRFERPFYWIEEGDRRDGPYCQRCYDVDTRLVRVQSTLEAGVWRCEACDKAFFDATYGPPESQSPPQSPARGSYWDS